MSGYWPNHNIPAMLNQALQTPSNPYTPPSELNPTMAVFGNDINAARALLAASIPPPSGAFITTNPPPPTLPSTTRNITLPASLARKRSKKDRTEINPSPFESSFNSDLSTSCQGVLPSLNTVTLHSTNTQTQIPTFDVLSKPGMQVTEETPTPVFSTEIGMGKEYPVIKEQPSQSILLDASNTRNKLFPHGAFRILHDNDHWHKFIISGPVSGNKEKILKRILELCDPTLLLPVMYQEEGDTAVFYARNCGSAIDRLCRNNHLIFEIDSQKYVLRILLQCAPVNRLKLNSVVILRKVLDKRFNSSDRCLDLSNFEHDPDLASTLYCPLSQPSLLHYILTLAIGPISPISFRTLRLSYNGIRILKVDILMKATFLRTLDLSHNELLYQTDLKDLKELTQVTRLILDGNPLCADFRTPEEYISKMKLLMPQLLGLDSASLFPGSISVPRVKNFLCSKEGHQMVDQFLKHFFDRYDWKDRRCLDGVYHNNALFSLTCVHLPGQSTSDGCSLTWYTTHNHNLAKLSDYSKVEKNMYHGPDEILELFSSLPSTEHDPYSFSVDLIHYNDTVAVVSVNGIFREHPSLPPEPDTMKSFRRVFVLSCTGPTEWQIVNEQLHISNPTTEQAEASFKIRRPPVQAPVAAWLVQDAQLLSDIEKEQMVCIMTQLTTLNQKYAKRFLVENHWYVREALISFVNKFEAKLLPEEAFTKDN